MEKLAMCRICMIQDVRMYYVADRNLQETFDKLVNAPLEYEGSRRLRVCYVCGARLLACHRLRLCALQTERRLHHLLDSTQFDVLAPQHAYRLQLVLPPLVQLSIPPTRPSFAPVTDDDTEDELAMDCFTSISNMDEHCEDTPANIKLEPIDLKEEPAHSTTSHTEIKPDPSLWETDGDTCQTNIQQGMYKLDDAIWKCDICDQLFSRSTKLLRHLRMHSINAKKKHKCPVCDITCKNRIQLLYHVRTHAWEQLSNNQEMIKDETNYKCDICYKCYRQRGSLYSHKRTHKGVKPHKCPTCEKAFVDKSVLIKHIRMHTGEKPFKCKLCGTCFRQQVTLMKHMRSHTGEKPYDCKICGKCFTEKGNLTRHILIHTGEKPFKCEICQKSFNQKITLTKHYLIH